MDLLNVLILALVQGLCELLPVSSSAMSSWQRSCSDWTRQLRK